jgi:hypothetical protein
MPTSRAVAGLSPVSIQTSRPSAPSCAIASRESGRTVSATAISPAGWSPMATNMERRNWVVTVWREFGEHGSDTEQRWWSDDAWREHRVGLADPVVIGGLGDLEHPSSTSALPAVAAAVSVLIGVLFSARGSPRPAFLQSRDVVVGDQRIGTTDQCCQAVPGAVSGITSPRVVGIRYVTQSDLLLWRRRRISVTCARMWRAVSSSSSSTKGAVAVSRP